MRLRSVLLAVAVICAVLALTGTSYASTSWTFTDATAPSATEAWLVSSNGYRFHTANGGATWTYDGGPSGLEQVTSADATHVWFVGHWDAVPHGPEYGGAFITATSDAGKTWSKYRALVQQATLPLVRVDAAAFSSPLNGVMFARLIEYWPGDSTTGTPKAVRTSDGGKTWSEISLPGNPYIRDACFKGAEGWAVGDGGVILHSSDKGATWAAQSSGTTEGLISVAFGDETHGIAVAPSGLLVRTSNGGATWTVTTIATTDESVTDVALRPGDIGMVVTDAGRVYTTTTGGATWTVRRDADGKAIRSCAYATDTKAYLVGDKVFLQTNDGGLTFTSPTVPTPPPYPLFVKYTNPIAYDLKSGQSTRFYTRTSAPNVWAKLFVTCPSGDKVIYDGPIASNTSNFYFPLWDGKDKYGRKMPTGFYRWHLQLTKAGISSGREENIIVSRVTWKMTGIAAGEAHLHHGYLRAGNVDCIVHVMSRLPEPGTVDMRLVGPGGLATPWYTIPAPKAGSYAQYWKQEFHGAIAPKVSGIHTFMINGGDDVTYDIDVMQ